MITGPIIAEFAALLGDPARATMVSALLDGRALTGSELASAARITPQTASTHLAKLTEAGVLSVVRNGRHRYFRLTLPTVADMIDGISPSLLRRDRDTARYPVKRARSVRPEFATTILRAASASISPILSSPTNTSCSTATSLRSRQQAPVFSPRSGSSYPRCVRPAATSADSASIGPSDVPTSRVR